MIVDYLEQNPVVMQGNGPDSLRVSDILENEHIHRYTQVMRHPSTWGGAIEIMAFTNIFQVQVNVRVLRMQRDIEFLPTVTDQTEFPCLRISWTGNHFEPIHDTHTAL